MPTKGGYSGGRTIATPGGGTLTVGGVQKGVPLTPEQTAALETQIAAVRTSGSPNELDDFISGHMKDIRYAETQRLGKRTVTRFYIGDTMGSVSVSPSGQPGMYTVTLSLAGIQSQQSNPFNQYARGLNLTFSKAEATKFVARFKRH